MYKNIMMFLFIEFEFRSECENLHTEKKGIIFSLSLFKKANIEPYNV
jgi:hypothetical protein